MMKGFLLAFVILLVELNSLFSTSDVSADNLQIASETYLRLKNERGHWHNQPRNAAIDDFNSDRHRAMIELQKHLGQLGTSADEIHRLMGEPTRTLDKPDLTLEHEFRHVNDQFVCPIDAKIWIYEWRNTHDYIYFVLSEANEVIRSGWFNAFE